MKKIAIIGTAGLPAKYGGFETLAHHLVDRLHNDFDITVYCSGPYYTSSERQQVYNGAKMVYIPLKANGIQSIPYDIISIIHALFTCDTLLIFGVSGCILLPLIKLLTNKKVAVNIDGLEWRRAKWNSFIQKFLQFSEWCAVKFSDADITDNEAIKRYTSINYKSLSYLIEYGGDQAQFVSLKADSYKKYPFCDEPYFFKVARIEPENNIEMILKAFAAMPSKTLVVVGNWKASLYGKELRYQYQNYNNLYLLDAIYDQKELDMLRSNCHAYVHGHSAGGTNPSLVEAMHLRVPVIAYKVSYNEATTEGAAIYFRDSDDLIFKIESSPEKYLNAVAMKMKNIAERRYTWSIIAAKYKSLILSFDYQYEKKSVYPEISMVGNRTLRKMAKSHLIVNKSLFV